MKKKILITVLCVVMVFAFAACGGSKSLEGKWTITSMMMGDQDYLQLAKDMAEATGEEFNVDEMVFIEFEKDGNFTISLDGEAEDGTYEVDGKTVTMTINDEPQKATLDGDTLTLDLNEDDVEMTMVFSKQK